MSDAELEARLEALLEAAELAFQAKEGTLDVDEGITEKTLEAVQLLRANAGTLAAVALRLARALRLGGEHDGPCDNVHAQWYDQEPCTLHIAAGAKRKDEALAVWTELLRSLSDG